VCQLCDSLELLLSGLDANSSLRRDMRRRSVENSVYWLHFRYSGDCSQPIDCGGALAGVERLDVSMLLGPQYSQPASHRY